MNDRLHDFRRLTSSSSIYQNGYSKNNKEDEEEDMSETALLSNVSTDAESPTLTYYSVYNKTNNNGMEDFFQKVSIIKLAFREISTNVDRLNKLKHSSIHLVSPDKEHDAARQISTIIQNNNALISKTKKALETVKLQNAIFSDKCVFSSEVKMRQNIHNQLIKKFRDSIQEFRISQAEYNQQIKQKAQRQIKLVYPEATTEDVVAMLESGDITATGAFRSCVVDGNENIEKAMLDLQGKSEDIKKLEKGVQDLSVLFLDLAEYVDMQDEAIEHIELSVTQAKDFSEQTYSELAEAKKYRDISRQRIFFFSVCLLTLAVFVLIPSLFRVVHSF